MSDYFANSASHTTCGFKLVPFATFKDSQVEFGRFYNRTL